MGSIDVDQQARAADYTLHKGCTETRIIVSQVPDVEAPEYHPGWRKILDEDDYAVLALRNLIFDICNRNGGGHGGSAIGMSAIGVALFKHVMRYNPADPDWFDRDRFVLSNGEYLLGSVPVDR